MPFPHPDFMHAAHRHLRFPEAAEPQAAWPNALQSFFADGTGVGGVTGACVTDGLAGVPGERAIMRLMSCQKRRRFISAAASPEQCLHVTRTYSAPSRMTVTA